MTAREMAQKVIATLRARPQLGGLEVSDTALRFVVADGSGLKTASVRLMPGIIALGRIQDEDALAEALRELRKQILGRKAGSKTGVNVIVSLSSVNIYTQMFNLPVIEGENLDKAIQLNIQMASPTGASESYAGWQSMQSKNNMQIEVLSAFLDRNIADSFVQVLRGEYFFPVALESRALSLSRLVKATGQLDSRSSAIVISADASGLDVSIIRNGHLHFDYFNFWKDLQGEEKQMSLEMFRGVVTRSVSQVLNFYNSHWKDPAGDILVSATGLKEEIIATIQQNFSMRVRELTPAFSPPAGPEWFIALGSALRARVPRREDEELSLLGVDAQESFWRQEVESFLSFWRILVPLALGILLVVFLGALVFLGRVKKEIETLAAFRVSQELSKEIRDLKSQADEFNHEVLLFRSADASAFPKSPLLKEISEITKRRGITIRRLTIQDKGMPVLFSGTAVSEDDIRQFKNELAITPGFREVKLALTDIRKEGSIYAFSITFLTQ